MVRMFSPALVAAILLCAACGGSPAQPTTTPSSQPPAAATSVRLEVKADEAGSRDAVASLSEVVADASASTGAGALTFAIDFGDGTVSHTSTARHVYAAPGTFTITATVTNAQGQRTSESRQIAVKPVTGSWFEAQYVRRTQRVEIRRLTLAAQDGLTVRGRYQVTGAAERAITGTLVPPRAIRIVADGGATLEGTLPSRLNDGAENWTLTAHGDSVDGERLEFRAITGDPAAPPPDADMKMSFGSGDATEPIAAVTPVSIDGTLSRGSGLSYFLEFGDGFVATTSQATHVVDAPHWPPLIARLTVVDGVGRADSESLEYRPFTLGNYFDDGWFFNDGFAFWLKFHFSERTGRTYVGRVEFGPPDVRGSVRATISAERDVRIVVENTGIEFRGTVELTPRPHMTLVQSGGRDSGRTWILAYHWGY